VVCDRANESEAAVVRRIFIASDRAARSSTSGCVVSSGRMTRNLRECRPGSLVSVAAFAYAGAMHATAVAGGKVVRFEFSPALARAHRQNRGKAMTEAEAVAFVETKRRARALRRARPYLASRP
jgi:Trk-type K+ transport system membrane component